MAAPFKYHNPLDNSCEQLDSEQLPYGCSHFIDNLMSDMISQPLVWLEKHYPEMTFILSNKRPKKGNFISRHGSGYIAAFWRTK